MKKIVSLMVSMLAIATLASCGGSKDKKRKIEVQNVKGGTADEQEAIQEATNMSIVLLSGSASILPSNVTDLAEDNGDYVLLSTSQVKKVNKKRYTVNYTWEADTSSPYYGEMSDYGTDHKVLSIEYPGKGAQKGQFTFKIAKVTCGGASSEDPGVEYTCNVLPATYYHEDITVAAINKVNEHNPALVIKDNKSATLATFDATYDLVDYEYKGGTYNPYFKTNNPGTEKEYYYVNAKGKMIYASPDGNWGLLADGDQITEVYAGSALNIDDSHYPAMKDKYVKVVGNLGQYTGNTQIGFVTRMLKMNKSEITEPTMNYQTIDETFLTSIEKDYGQGIKGQRQCVPGMNLSNALSQVTGTFVPGSILNNDGATATVNDSGSINYGARCSFKMKVGAKEITVAYDYHVDREGTIGIFDALKTVMNSNGSSSFTIKGTLRYNCSDESPFVQNSSNPGHWELVPFAADHVASAK